jgi:hypothetical protein
MTPSNRRKTKREIQYDDAGSLFSFAKRDQMASTDLRIMIKKSCKTTKAENKEMKNSTLFCSIEFGFFCVKPWAPFRVFRFFCLFFATFFSRGIFSRKVYERMPILHIVMFKWKQGVDGLDALVAKLPDGVLALKAIPGVLELNFGETFTTDRAQG